MKFIFEYPYCISLLFFLAFLLVNSISFISFYNDKKIMQDCNLVSSKQYTSPMTHKDYTVSSSGHFSKRSYYCSIYNSKGDKIRIQISERAYNSIDNVTISENTYIYNDKEYVVYIFLDDITLLGYKMDKETEVSRKCDRASTFAFIFSVIVIYLVSFIKMFSQ